MDRLAALIATLVVGGLVALQPPVNALLARNVSDLGAGFVALALSTLMVGVLLLLIGEPSALKGLSEFRPVHLLGAVAGAAIVTVSLITVRSLGAGGVAAVLVAGQLLVAVVLDRLGVLGLDVVEQDWKTWLGVVLLLGGTVLVTLA